MAFSVTNRVKVVDQSSEFRNLRGSVIAIPQSGLNDVRLETQGCRGNKTLLRNDQLALDTSTLPVSYAQCTG